MGKQRAYIFVLWGEAFEEVTASIFVTEFREAGFFVKLVSLTNRILPGANGLALVPDWTIEQALISISSACGIVLPCSSRGINQIQNDPRLINLFQKAYSSQVVFITGQVDISTLLVPTNQDEMRNRVWLYPEKEHLVPFARQLVLSLTKFL